MWKDRSLTLRVTTRLFSRRYVCVAAPAMAPLDEKSMRTNLPCAGRQACEDMMSTEAHKARTVVVTNCHRVAKSLEYRIRLKDLTFEGRVGAASGKVERLRMVRQRSIASTGR